MKRGQIYLTAIYLNKSVPFAWAETNRQLTPLKYLPTKNSKPQEIYFSSIDNFQLHL